MLNIKKIATHSLNFDILKIVALITMVIDHIGYTLLPYNMDLRIIGRTTFPIFAFLLSYHLAKQSIFKKYIPRLFFFAVLSTLVIAPFDLKFNGYFKLNIFWSFLIAVLSLFIFDKISKEKTDKRLKLFIIALCFSFFGALSYLCDYKLTGFVLVLSLYFYFKTNNKIFFTTALIDSALINSDDLFFAPQIVVPFIVVTVLTTFYLLYQSKYIQKKQIRFLKPWWIFYLFYPVHFLILYLIKTYYF